MDSKQLHTVEISWKIHRILNKFNRLESKPIKLSAHKTISHRELHVIQAIGELEQINITQIGTHFGVTKSAASQVVNKLVRKGLVEKELAPHSGKEYRISLTHEGWEAYKLHEKHHSKNIKEISRRLSSFSPSQIAGAAEILDIIEGILDQRVAEKA